MNEKDIVEGNKLIIKDRDYLRIIESFMGYAEGYLSQIITWNDLMLVVEKIENITDGNSYLYSFDIGRDWCIIETNDFNPHSIAKSYPKDKLKSVWECVVAFIKYYNSQTNPTNT